MLSVLHLIAARLVRSYLNFVTRYAFNKGYPDLAIHSRRDYIATDIILYGYWEINEINCILSIVNSLNLNGAFLDVGANIGCYSVYLGPYFSRTISFEPCPSNYSLLSHNLRFSLSSPYSALQIALGSRSERLNLEVDTSNRGGARLKPLNTQQISTSVEVTSLDELLADHSKNSSLLAGHSIDLIKIDVEGFENEVIQGSISTIRHHQPVIAFEYLGLSTFDYSHLYLLEDSGYKLLIYPEASHPLLRIFSSCASLRRLTQASSDQIISSKKHHNLIFAIPPRFCSMIH